MSGNPSPNGNPSWSDLDQTQIIQRVMEESTDRLRVDAQVSAVITDVEISSSQSSIAVGNPGNSNTLNVNSDGSIDVDVVLNSGTDSITTVPTNYIVQMDTSSSSTQYVGKAAPGTANSSAGWLIAQLSISSSGISVLYANGSGTSFNQIWNNRASLSYS